LARYAEAASLLVGSPAARAEEAGPALARLAAELGVRGLGSFGLRSELFPDLIGKAQAASSMRGNPISLSPDELRAVLEAGM
jgi:alcohol dehydrogenase class IV